MAKSEMLDLRVLQYPGPSLPTLEPQVYCMNKSVLSWKPSLLLIIWSKIYCITAVFSLFDCTIYGYVFFIEIKCNCILCQEISARISVILLPVEVYLFFFTNIDDLVYVSSFLFECFPFCWNAFKDLDKQLPIVMLTKVWADYLSFLLSDIYRYFSNILLARS